MMILELYLVLYNEAVEGPRATSKVIWMYILI